MHVASVSASLRHGMTIENSTAASGVVSVSSFEKVVTVITKFKNNIVRESVLCPINFRKL
jgi:hypothetical protein